MTQVLAPEPAVRHARGRTLRFPVRRVTRVRTATRVDRPRSLADAVGMWSLATLSVLAVWFALYVLVLGAVQEQASQQKLFGSLRRQLSQATAPVGPAREGAPVALIDAPAAGIGRAVVVEGTTSRDLQDGPGHRRDTVLPGQAGVSVVYGKAATYGAPFAHLGDLRPGDPVDVVTGQGVAHYRVSGTRHAGDPLPALPAGGAGRLTLVSQEGSGWRAGWAPDHEVFVDATLDKAQPAAGARPAVEEDEVDGASSTAPLLPLVLWLEALLAVVVLGLVATRRWGRWQTWFVASPVLAAVLVGTSRQAAALLPNLL